MNENLSKPAKIASPVDGQIHYVPSTQHHGPYITTEFGTTICDFYTMTLPNERSTANGGESKPVHFLHEMADPNAETMAHRWNCHDELLRQLKESNTLLESYTGDGSVRTQWKKNNAVILKACKTAIVASAT